MIKWHAQFALNRGKIELLALIDHGGSELHVAQPINMVMHRQDRNVAIEAPTLALDQRDAQSLLQALWDAGVRPAENTDRSGEVNALKSHIGFAEHVAKALLPNGGAR